MKFKGTQGEWKITNTDGQRYQINDGDIDVWDLNIKHSEMAANANLIAAAPDLLEALQMVVICSNFEARHKAYGTTEKHWTSKVQAAINKALK